MRPFTYVRAETDADAVRAASTHVDVAPTSAPAQFLAGGTNILDFMKLGSWKTDALVDVNDLQRDYGAIEAGPAGLRLGAMVRMSQAADHPAINREYPVIAQALKLAASAQIRNMASLGGNVLQRTRCTYFRNADNAQCNKRVPGSGCAAIGGNNRTHAVLGVSELCISNYPGISRRHWPHSTHGWISAAQPVAGAFGSRRCTAGQSGRTSKPFSCRAT